MTKESPGGNGGEIEQRFLDEARVRLTLRILHEFDEPITLADLAEEVAIRERDAPITDVSGDAVTDVYLSLYHSYVPTLAESAVVEYDQERDMVQLTDNAVLERLTASDGESD